MLSQSVRMVRRRAARRGDPFLVPARLGAARKGARRVPRVRDGVVRLRPALRRARRGVARGGDCAGGDDRARIAGRAGGRRVERARRPRGRPRAGAGVVGPHGDGRRVGRAGEGGAAAGREAIEAAGAFRDRAGRAVRRVARAAARRRDEIVRGLKAERRRQFDDTLRWAAVLEEHDGRMPADVFAQRAGMPACVSAAQSR